MIETIFELRIWSRDDEKSMKNVIPSINFEIVKLINKYLSIE